MDLPRRLQTNAWQVPPQGQGHLPNRRQVLKTVSDPALVVEPAIETIGAEHSDFIILRNFNKNH
jgi:hypothetical protein